MKMGMGIGKRLVVSGTIAMTVAAASIAPAAAAGSYGSQSYQVTTDADSGDGSLRAGLESGADRIVINKSVGDIRISETLTYTGSEPLRISGFGQTVKGGDFTLFEVENGANLAVSKVNFAGPGGFDIDSGGNNEGGIGLLVTVPEDRTGTVKVDLNRVTVSGVARHGIHISDCDLAVCGSGQGGGGVGSPASVDLRLDRVHVRDAGNGAFDNDGVRVDERSDGDIRFYASRSVFTDVGADGVELDEGGDGDVRIYVRKSVFQENGGFCDGLPEVEPDPSPIPECYDEGELDLDDGFDVDEADAGSILGVVTNSDISNNLDEGLDFDEGGDGGYAIYLNKLVANGNGDEGIKVSEEGSGDLVAKLRKVTAKANGAAGVLLEEEEAGNLRVDINRLKTANNDGSGLEVTEDGDGDGNLRVTRSDIKDGIASNVGGNWQ